MADEPLTATALRLSEALPRVIASATEAACRRQPSRWAAQEAACASLLGLWANALLLALSLQERALFEAQLRGVAPLLGRRDVGPDEVAATLRDLAAALRAQLSAEDAARVLPLLERSTQRLQRPGADAHEQLLQALLAGDVEEGRLLLQAGLRHGHLYVYEHLVQPAMEAVGELWRTHRIGVADEHLATAVARTVVASLYPGFPWPRGGPRALLTCVQGELHDFGVQLLSDLLALEGWDVQNLGADTPTGELVQRVRQVRPAFVGLSVCRAELLPEAAQAARVLRAEVPGVPLVVGGQALRSPGPSAEGLGVDALAHGASEALELVGRWRP
ncbi:MAG TPA: cobalamin-dependent protein [Aggregicoccus sp.]|nr:cobalamin-dependent protein [Aggregicoccus sp.]